MSTIFEPTDSWNTKLRQDVFPPDWTNPEPSGKYNLVVIGGGTRGLVAAAGAAGLGAKVTVIEMDSRLLAREDLDAARIVETAMKQDGVEFLYDAKLSKVEPCEGGHRLLYTVGDDAGRLEVDKILLGAGRAPNVDGLGLKQAGVEADKTGIQVDERLRTTNKRIYAVGDVAMKHKFTHAAGAAARVVIQNALFMRRKKITDEVIPWCTYTDPEIAHVGMYESEAREAGYEVDTLTQKMSSVDRAILDGEDEGLLKVYLKKGSDTLLGATLVGTHAGESLPELTLSLTAKMGLGKIGKTIHTYPPPGGNYQEGCRCPCASPADAQGGRPPQGLAQVPQVIFQSTIYDDTIDTIL